MNTFSSKLPVAEEDLTNCSSWMFDSIRADKEATLLDSSACIFEALFENVSAKSQILLIASSLVE
jgi:hypothetical protein